jgi:hypothetical protein
VSYFPKCLIFKGVDLANFCTLIGLQAKGDPVFNTLKYAKILESVGFSKDQAEASTQISSRNYGRQACQQTRYERLSARYPARYKRLEN